jgi:hypothetical protein
LIFIIFFILYSHLKNQDALNNSSTTTPQVYISPTPIFQKHPEPVTLIPSQKYQDWYEYNVNSVTDWASFKIHYPKSWSLTVEQYSDPFSKDQSSLTVRLIYDQNNAFLILQGSGGGARCRFPDDADYANPVGFERLGDNYIQIKNKDITWRFVKIENPDLPLEENVSPRYVLCQKSDDKSQWTDRLSIALSTEIKINSDNAYNDLKQILQRIEINN